MDYDSVPLFASSEWVDEFCGGEVASKVKHVTSYEVVRPLTQDKVMVTVEVSNLHAWALPTAFFRWRLKTYERQCLSSSLKF